MTSYLTTQNPSYTYCFRKIEDWLNSLNSEKSQDSLTTSLSNQNIDYICCQLRTAFSNIFFALTPKKRVTFVIVMLNTSIRIYAADQSAMITSSEEFVDLVDFFTDQSDTILASKTHDEFTVLMLDLLLRNFVKDGFLIDYLERLFPKSGDNVTGTVSDHQYQNILPIGFASEYLFKRLKHHQINEW